jgi:hypothetical protein
MVGAWRGYSVYLSEKAVRHLTRTGTHAANDSATGNEDAKRKALN